MKKIKVIILGAGDFRGYRAADVYTSVDNHMIGFAAEQARITRRVVDVQEFIGSFVL